MPRRLLLSSASPILVHRGLRGLSRQLCWPWMSGPLLSLPALRLPESRATNAEAVKKNRERQQVHFDVECRVGLLQLNLAFEFKNIPQSDCQPFAGTNYSAYGRPSLSKKYKTRLGLSIQCGIAVRPCPLLCVVYITIPPVTSL